MSDQIVITKIAAGITAVIVLAVLLFLIRAYLDAQRCLHWYKQRYYSQPRCFQAPTLTWHQRLLNMVLFITPSKY